MLRHPLAGEISRPANDVRSIQSADDRGSERSIVLAIRIDCEDRGRTLKKGAAAVLTIDSDGQHDAAFAPTIVGALDRADIVSGTRDLTGKGVPKHRRIANMISSAATRAVSGGKVRDSQSGYRAMKAEVLRKVNAVGDRYEFETDFIIRAARAGFTIVNVPISTIYGSPSYFREFRDAWLVIRVLWRHRAGIWKR